MRLLENFAAKMLLLTLGVGVLGVADANAGDRRPRWCPPLRSNYCPPICPPTSPPATTAPVPEPSPVPAAPGDGGETAPAPPTADDVVNDNQQNIQQPQPQAQFNPAVANVGRSGSRGDRAPNMIGDFFGTSGAPYINGGFGIIPAPLSTPTIYGNLAAAPGANVGRLKLTENASLIPKNRYFVNYSYFNDARIVTGVDIHRVTPGFETTVLNDDMSVEVRFPFASTVSSSHSTMAGAPRTGNSEFGNMSLWFKKLLTKNSTWAVSTGVGLTLPTADDYFVTDGANAIRVENSSIHFLPFIGALYTPNRKFFAQGMIQLDVDGNGNDVFAGGPTAGTFAGRAHDNTYLFIDVAAGYWIYENPSRSAAIKRMAPIVEIHHNTTLTDGDALGQIDVAAPGGLAVTNIVLGLTADLNSQGGPGSKTVTIGYTTPVFGDEQFDGELRLIFSWTP